ncbi:flagellar basal body rod protein [Parvibaculum lavamentivorans DS-1]|uniref:Flagellar basal-body rod protein FlgF n=1 Tax=Parvibaculum lavamentivorans (strain DS-1 / DSM 13023 / NCIMB 13966) TaxID=402881 RepID=A7HW88_PARL1|nr:flagellar basal-body rod protein FlgF [Parvibaculum lavamentivorans]ABS64171.1 flagellar basal body rod protein [Parvibaculum lavamentivorans DS-1]
MLAPGIQPDAGFDMENALLIGLSRQMAMSREMATIANNIANMNTTAYKSEAMLFEEFLAKDASEDSPDSTIRFVQDVGQHRNLRDGALQTTGNPFDVAITGEGFFRVETGQGVLYTRNGNFQLDADGQLVTSNGDPILTDAGTPITFARDEIGITIARDGTISSDRGLRGKLAIVTFENQQEMRKAGNSLLSTAQEEVPAENIRLVQGALEGSNVNPILEMTNMIEVTRSYASAQKLIDQADQMRRKAIQDLGAAA